MGTHPSAWDCGSQATSPIAAWFDVEGRDARVRTRKLEKAHQHTLITETKIEWKIQFIEQRALCQLKFASL